MAITEGEEGGEEEGGGGSATDGGGLNGGGSMSSAGDDGSVREQPSDGSLLGRYGSTSAAGRHSSLREAEEEEDEEGERDAAAVAGMPIAAEDGSLRLKERDGKMHRIGSLRFPQAGPGGQRALLTGVHALLAAEEGEEGGAARAGGDRGGEEGAEGGAGGGVQGLGKLVAHRAQSMRGPLAHGDSFNLGAPAAGGGSASDAAAGGHSHGHHSHGQGGGRKAGAGGTGPAGRSLLGSSVESVLEGGGSLPDVHSFVAKHSHVGDEEGEGEGGEGSLHGRHLSDGSDASSSRLQYAALLGAQGMGIQTARSAQSGYGPSSAPAYGSGPYGDLPGVGRIGQPDFSMPRLIAMGAAAAAGGRLPGSPGYLGVAPTSRSGGEDSVGGGMAAFGAGADDSVLPSRLSKLDLYYRPVKDAERMVVVIPGQGAGSGAPSPAAPQHYMVPLSASSSSGGATPVDGAAGGGFRSPSHGGGHRQQNAGATGRGGDALDTFVSGGGGGGTHRSRPVSRGGAGSRGVGGVTHSPLTATGGFSVPPGVEGGNPHPYPSSGGAAAPRAFLAMSPATSADGHMSLEPLALRHRLGGRAGKLARQMSDRLRSELPTADIHLASPAGTPTTEQLQAMALESTRAVTPAGQAMAPGGMTAATAGMAATMSGRFGHSGEWRVRGRTLRAAACC